MKEWTVKYQATPTSRTTAGLMVVEADSKESVFATAYDNLTRRGHIVGAYDSMLTDLGLDIGKVREFGVPGTVPNTSITIILSIEPHQVTAPGRVVEAH